jgi:ribose/xylose/arabinose/galactoside ABC-type transport system permease subunit
MTFLSGMLPPSTYGFFVALFMWMLISFHAGLGNPGVVLSPALCFAAISVIIGLEQMFVLASSVGTIDLSTPSVLALAAYTSMEVMDGHDGLRCPSASMLIPS